MGRTACPGDCGGDGVDGISGLLIPQQPEQIGPCHGFLLPLFFRPAKWILVGPTLPEETRKEREGRSQHHRPGAVLKKAEKVDKVDKVDQPGGRTAGHHNLG